MGKLFQTLNRVLHEASNVVIESRVTTKMADALSTVVKSSFDVIEQVFKVVNEATQPTNGGSAAAPRGKSGRGG